MRITARVRNGPGLHEAVVRTGDAERQLTIPPKVPGSGSSVNGGELLFLALATCYCNDVYREAGKRGIAIASVDVEVVGEFGAEGEAASRIEYSARVVGSGSEQELRDLLATTDRVAEIQNTVRRGVQVTLTRMEVARG